MPRTREHLEICQLLRVKLGLVVLAPPDLVEADWLELVEEEVREALQGTFLEGAPLVRFSAVTGAGPGGAAGHPGGAGRASAAQTGEGHLSPAHQQGLYH